MYSVYIPQIYAAQYEKESLTPKWSANLINCGFYILYCMYTVQYEKERLSPKIVCRFEQLWIICMHIACILYRTKKREFNPKIVCRFKQVWILNACTLFKSVGYEEAGMGRVGEGRVSGVVDVWMCGEKFLVEFLQI